jgi:hypothetical protein
VLAAARCAFNVFRIAIAPAFGSSVRYGAGHCCFRSGIICRFVFFLSIGGEIAVEMEGTFRGGDSALAPLFLRILLNCIRARDFWATDCLDNRRKLRSMLVPIKSWEHERSIFILAIEGGSIHHGCCSSAGRPCENLDSDK